MKKLVLVLMFSVLSTAFYGQAAFDKFDGLDDVTSVIVNKKMFEMMGSVKMENKDKVSQQYLSLIKKLDNLKVFTSNSTRVTSEMKATADKYMKSAGLEELMRINDSGRNIKIWVKSGSKDSQIKELLMFMEETSKGNEILGISQNSQS